MSDTFVLQSVDGHFVQWRSSSLVSLGLKEADLESAIVAQPGPLVLDQLDLLFDRVVVYDQKRLRSGSGHRSIPDVIILTDHGDIVVVEVKRLGNPELRGRAVLAQVVDYAATLSSTDEGTLVSRLTSGRVASWEQLCRLEFGHTQRPDMLARRFQSRIEEAEIHLVIACDEAPAALADWVRAAGRQSALGFDLHVVEVRPLVPSQGPRAVAWAPVLRVSTEIVHRTCVTVRTEGAGVVQVDVSTDTADQIDAAVQSSTGRNKQAAAIAVMAPVAERVGLSPEALWLELDRIHRKAITLDWREVREALASPNDSGPNLRGKKGDGFIEGRFGVNLVRSWQPAVFVGAYLLPHDHVQPLLAPDDGGDFALILDVLRDKRFDGDAFSEHDLFTRLRDRLRQDSGAWDFADHHAQLKRNRWHPLHLRRPLVDVLDGTRTSDERFERWLSAAQDAVRVLLAGGELAQLHRKFVGEG